MNIWEAYCDSGLYNVYFDLLVAKGFGREDAESLKNKYCVYLQRIKNTAFANELKGLKTIAEFKSKLVDIFENKWRDHINVRYEDVIPHYYKYLVFLDSMQALYDDYIDEGEKVRLLRNNSDNKLTVYETEYMVDGKLVALMNPQLLNILRDYIVNRGISPRRVSIVCQNFYDGILDMSSAEYADLVKKIWNPGRGIRKGGGRNKIGILYPDGLYAEFGTQDALREVISYYGFNDVYKKKFQIRGEDLLVKYVTVGKDKLYNEIGEGMYMLLSGNAKDRLNAARMINHLCGERLKIEMI
jgi:hypothetical protein